MHVHKEKQSRPLLLWVHGRCSLSHNSGLTVQTCVRRVKRGGDVLLSAGPAPLILVLCYSSIRVPATQLNPHTTGSLRPWAAPFPFSWWAVPMARHRNLGLQIFVYGPQSPETTPKQSGVDLYPLQFVRMFQSIRCSIASIRTCVLSQGIVRKNNYRNSLNTNTEVTFIIGCLILPVHHQNVRHHLCPRTPVGKLVCGGGSPPEQEPTGGLRKGPPEHHQSWWKCFSFGIGLRDTLSILGLQQCQVRRKDMSPNKQGIWGLKEQGSPAQHLQPGETPAKASPCLAARWGVGWDGQRHKQHITLHQHGHNTSRSCSQSSSILRLGIPPCFPSSWHSTAAHPVPVALVLFWFLITTCTDG